MQTLQPEEIKPQTGVPGTAMQILQPILINLLVIQINKLYISPPDAAAYNFCINTGIYRTT